MDLLDDNDDMPDAIALLSEDQKTLLAQYWDDDESELANHQVILHWLRYPEIPDRV